MDPSPRAWVLNLEAEHELERGRRYAPTRHQLQLVERQLPRLAERLLGERDVLLGPAGPTDRRGRALAPEAARGLAGQAWSPTPGALRRLRAAGASMPDAPTPEVLARVNSRAFTARLDAPEPGLAKTIVADLEPALEHLARPSALGWLVRRPFGAAGRGRRRLHAGRPDPGELAWLAASLRRGPLVLEPFVRIERETTRCAWLRPSGELSLAAPGFQRTTAAGAWLETLPAEARAIRAADDARLQQALERAGRALHAAGYFGPFGIDAFWYRDGGRLALQPLGEINARFTMDWEPAAIPALLERT